MTRIIVLAVACIAGAGPAIGADCGMPTSFSQLDEGGAKTVTVYEDNTKPALLFADAMKVNTDGTLRSYSVDDFWGERVALNNLCNASSDKCDGLTPDQMKARRIFVQKAKADGWPKDDLAATKIDENIIPFRDGRPCPEQDGFLVSATALHKKVIKDQCDISNYVDSLKVSAVVLPRGVKPRGKPRLPSEFQKRGAEVGDLAVAISADFSVVSYSVVGDTGPATELGEVSVALAKNLLKKKQLPANYQEVRGRGEYKGQGWNPKMTFVVIFPRTRDSDNPFMTQDRINAAAAPAFEKWGGLDRLRSCASNYK